MPWRWCRWSSIFILTGGFPPRLRTSWRSWRYKAVKRRTSGTWTVRPAKAATEAMVLCDDDAPPPPPSSPAASAAAAAAAGGGGGVDDDEDDAAEASPFLRHGQ